jgi:hypothetical protein
MLSCSSDKKYNYDIQVVGYNKIERYYIIKNSLGENWGEKGFGKISMDEDCEIRRYVTKMTLKKVLKDDELETLVLDKLKMKISQGDGTEEENGTEGDGT